PRSTEQVDRDNARQGLGNHGRGGSGGGLGAGAPVGFAARSCRQTLGTGSLARTPDGQRASGRAIAGGRVSRFVVHGAIRAGSSRMTNPSDAVTNTGRGLERLRRRIALIGNDAYRRDGWRLLLADMRGWLCVRTLLAAVVLAISGAWLAYHSVTTPREAHQLLARLFGFGALLAGAGLFASDQRQGTFELLWLATGSRRKLLAHRIIVQLIAFTLLAVPA